MLCNVLEPRFLVDVEIQVAFHPVLLLTMEGECGILDILAITALCDHWSFL